MRTLLYLSMALICSAFCFGDFHPSQADLNGDGIVNLADLALFASAWLWESPCANAAQALIDVHYIASTETSDWYVFTPSLTTTYLVDICDGDTVGYTGMVYDACWEPFLGTTNGDCFVVVEMNAGEDYYIQIEKTGLPTEDYDLLIRFPPE